jgi:sulfatase maturation enzyme AslB (radical SAM superfamily)
MNFKEYRRIRENCLDRCYVSFLGYTELHRRRLSSRFLKTKIGKSLFNIYARLRFLVTRRVPVPILDFKITTRCTLKCRECASLMDFYGDKTHHTDSFELFKRRLDKLLSACDRIYYFTFIGGEPLVCKDLANMVE